MILFHQLLLIIMIKYNIIIIKMLKEEKEFCIIMLQIRIILLIGLQVLLNKDGKMVNLLPNII